MEYSVKVLCSNDELRKKCERVVTLLEAYVKPVFIDNKPLNIKKHINGEFTTVYQHTECFREGRVEFLIVKKLLKQKDEENFHAFLSTLELQKDRDGIKIEHSITWGNVLFDL